MSRGVHIKAIVLAILGLALAAPLIAFADEEVEAPVARTYAAAPPAAQGETQAEADAKSAGCKSCHTTTDAMTMHETPAVVLGCADCHGGDAHVTAPPGLKKTDAEYAAIRDRAHVLPRYPQAWNYPSSAKPKAATRCSTRNRRSSSASSIRPTARGATGLRRLPPARSSRRPSAR